MSNKSSYYLSQYLLGEKILIYISKAIQQTDTSFTSIA